MSFLSLRYPHDHQLHTEVEVLNRHVVDLPERVAGLPKELESRESPIPYDYDLSIEDPQDRVIENNIVELDVKVLAAVQSPPIAFLERGGTLGQSKQQEEGTSSSPAQTNSNSSEETAACCVEEHLKLDPPSLLAASIPIVEASGDAVSVGQVDIAIPRKNPHSEQKQKQKLPRNQKQQQQQQQQQH